VKFYLLGRKQVACIWKNVNENNLTLKFDTSIFQVCYIYLSSTWNIDMNFTWNIYLRYNLNWDYLRMYLQILRVICSILACVLHVFCLKCQNLKRKNMWTRVSRNVIVEWLYAALTEQSCMCFFGINKKDSQYVCVLLKMFWWHEEKGRNKHNMLTPCT
jgi:hypothetical protein